MAFFNDSSVVSTGKDAVARLWDISPGETPPPSAEPSDGVLHATAAGDHVYALHSDGLLRKWEIATGECVGQLYLPEPGEGMVCSWYWPSRNTLLLAVGWRVYRCDLESGTCEVFFTSRAKRVVSAGPVVDNWWYVNEEPGGLSRFLVTPDGLPFDRQVTDWVRYEVVGDRWLVGKFGNALELLDLTDSSPQFRRLRPASSGTFRAVVDPDSMPSPAR